MEDIDVEPDQHYFVECGTPAFGPESRYRRGRVRSGSGYGPTDEAVGASAYAARMEGRSSLPKRPFPSANRKVGHMWPADGLPYHRQT